MFKALNRHAAPDCSSMAETSSSRQREEFVLELRDVSFSVSGKTLLHSIDLTVSSGKSIALIGHNGSGKSTLLELVGRQLEPTTGTIVFENKPVSAWRAREFARRLGSLPQHTPAAPGMLVHELVTLGRYPWHGALGRFSETDRAKVDEAMQITETEVFRDRMVDSLSGGERQRVWLAMLVAQDARCLLLDEPISALDISHQLDVLRLVSHLCRTRGITVVSVLHDVNMAARFCDRIVALSNGRLIADGTPDQIMTQDELMRIYGVQMEIVAQQNGRPAALAR